MGMITTIAMGVVALSALLVVVSFMRAMPRTTFVVWALVMFFVPIWIGLAAGPLFVSVITIVTLLAVVAFGRDLRFSLADALMIALVAIVALQYVLGVINLNYTVVTVLEWALPYLWGRLVLSRLRPAFAVQCLAVFGMIAAAVALVEVFTKTNVFVLMKQDDSLYSVWGTLQMRGDHLRAEGAWGHSIAFGSALAMCSSFVLATQWKPVVRVLGVVLISVASVLTLSRTAMFVLMLTLALSVVLLPRVGRLTRGLVIALGCIGAIVAGPFIASIFSDQGQEAEASAGYRTDLFSLFAYVKPFGSADSFLGVTSGGQYLGNFAKSIDNAFLLTALRLGWFGFAAFCLVILIAVASPLLSRHVTPAAIAVAAQIPGLFTVALITQFGMFFWFAVGLAVGWDSLLRHSREDAASPDERRMLLGMEEDYDPISTYELTRSR